MTTFTTITEKEILNIAWEYKLRKWLQELDKNERSKEERDRENLIAAHLMKKYKSQLDELDAAIRAIDNAE